MKKIILTVAAVFALTFANAQDKKEKSSEGFSKGDLYLTGTAGFSSDKTALGVKTDGLTLAPGIGYFLTENVALVGGLDYNSTKVGNAKTTGLGLHAGVKYFWTPASKFSLSIGGELSYMTSKEDTFDVKTNTIGLTVPVGLHYFVSDAFAITSTWGGLNYSSAKADTSGAKAATNLGLRLDMSSISFGLLYKL
ncbi:outer membrane beta-barrel protein [Flavobacterium sp.]|uniref:outer membrane beta-barrel protein n=1 Tax=Flavobacterium sp. TaxID=239 RepID=UPI0025FF3AB3|nr:outer membrane beta-barrel protein [Flavobacterium sp.]